MPLISVNLNLLSDLFSPIHRFTLNSRDLLIFKNYFLSSLGNRYIFY